MHLVMFDIDGTLVHTDDFEGELYLKAVKDVLGISITDDWNEYIHVTDSGILDQVLTENKIKGDRKAIHSQVKRRFVELNEAYVRDDTKTICEIPGANTLISKLAERKNVALAIATGGWEETAKIKLKSAGIDYKGVHFASASDALTRIDIMKLAEERASNGRSFRKRTYLGDSAWDKRACAEIGYDFIAVGQRVDHEVRFDDLSNHKEIMSKIGL